MADIELARAYVELIPVTKGISKRAKEEIFPNERDAEGPAKRAGKSFSDRLGSILKKSAVGVGVAAGGLLGTALVKGFGRLSAIENAEAKLRGLGNSASDVSSIMDNALAAVKGTAFGMDEAATTAASAVAAGIKPGKELESYLALVGDAATIAGTSMSDMGSIFNKVATSGKVQGDVFAQLGDKGIPIVALLSEKLGVSAEEVYKLGSAGKISSDDFLDAMSSMSGAALEGGNTTSGAFKNMGAALSRFGAELLSGVFPLIGPFFGAITGAIDQATSAVGPLIEKITPAITRASEAALGFVTDLIDSAAGIAEVFRSGDFDPSKWADGINEDSPLVTVAFAVRDAWVTVRDAVTPVIGAVRDAIVAAIPYVRDLWSWFSELSLGAKALFGGSAIVGGLATFGKLGSTFGALAGKVKKLLGPLGRFAPVLRLMVGPVGLIVGGLVALIATNEDVRESFGNLLEVLGDVIGSTLSTLAPIVADLATQLGPVLGAAALAVGSALQALAPVVVWIVDGIASLLKWLEPAMPLLAGVAGGVFALVKVFGVLAPIFTTVFGVVMKVVGVLSKIGPIITALTGPVGWIVLAVGALGVALWAFFTKTEKGRELWDKIWGGIKDVAAAVVGWFTDTAWPVMQAAWDGIMAAALAVVAWFRDTAWPIMQSVGEGIAAVATWLWQNIMQPAWEGIKIAVAVAAALIMSYIDLLKWYFESVIAPVALWLYHNVIKPAWDGIQAAISAVVTWVRDTGWPILKAAWDAIAGAATWLWQNVLKPAWAGIQAAIDAVVKWFQGTAWPIFSKVIEWLKMSFEGWKLLAKRVWDAVRSAVNAVVGWFRDTAWPIVSRVIDLLKMSFEGWKLLAKRVWDAVRSAISAVVSWFRDTAWPIISRVIESIKSGFNRMRDTLKSAWGYVKNNVIQPVASWFRDTVKPLFDTATDKIGDAFKKLKDTVKTAWDGIKSTAKAPIRFVVQTVVNDALVKNFNKVAKKIGVGTLPEVRLPSGFWRGGILPGMSRMSDGDDQLVPMRRGEGVLVSEGLRTPKDRAAFLDVNARARRGVGFASMLGGEGFAGGGILGRAWGKTKQLAGHALDKVLDGVDFVSEALKDPASIFKKVYDAVVGQMPAAGLFGEAATGASKKLLGGVIDTVKKALSPSGDLPDVGAIKGGGSLGLAQRLAAAYGLTMTSFRRGGARTAGSGSVSLHALGRAMDFSNSSGPTPQMMAFFNAMHKYKPTELLYSSAGARQWRRSGRMADTSGVTKRMHYNHVHVGFNRGGIYDKGGWLPPGGVGVNLSNRPEPVFTGAQWDLLAKGIEDRRGLGPASWDTDDLEAIAEAIAGGARDGSREGVAAGLSGSAGRARTLSRMGV